LERRSSYRGKSIFVEGLLLRLLPNLAFSSLELDRVLYGRVAHEHLALARGETTVELFITLARELLLVGNEPILLTHAVAIAVIVSDLEVRHRESHALLVQLGVEVPLALQMLVFIPKVGSGFFCFLGLLVQELSQGIFDRLSLLPGNGAPEVERG